MARNIHAKQEIVGFDCTQQREDPGTENSLNTATQPKQGRPRYRQKKSIQERSPERSPVQAKPRQLRGTDKSKGPRIEEGSGRTVVGSLRCCEGGDGTKSEASIRRRRERCGFFFLFLFFLFFGTGACSSRGTAEQGEVWSLCSRANPSIHQRSDDTLQSAETPTNGSVLGLGPTKKP